MRQTLPLILLALLASPASAQTPGMPVYGGGFSPGLELGGAVAFPGSDSRTGDGTVYGATLTLGAPLVGVAGTLARLGSAGGGPERWAYGALASLKLLGSPLSPLGIYAQAGAGTMEDSNPDSSQLFIPVGLALTLTIPTPYLSVRPWIAPRMDVTRTSFQGTSSSNEVFAFSTGFNLTLLTGLSFRASYEMIKNQDPTVAFGAAMRF